MRLNLLSRLRSIASIASRTLAFASVSPVRCCESVLNDPVKESLEACPCRDE